MLRLNDILLNRTTLARNVGLRKLPEFGNEFCTLLFFAVVAVVSLSICNNDNYVDDDEGDGVDDDDFDDYFCYLGALYGDGDGEQEDDDDDAFCDLGTSFFFKFAPLFMIKVRIIVLHVLKANRKVNEM